MGFSVDKALKPQYRADGRRSEGFVAAGLGL